MQEGQGAELAGTEGKSPSSDKPSVSERFIAQVEEWKKTGCPYKSRKADDTIKICGAAPHRAKQITREEGKIVVFQVDCVEGHEEQWEFLASAEEIKADAKKQFSAQQNGERVAAEARAAGRNPMVAELHLKLNMMTHEFNFEPFIPSPGIGLQMLALAQKAIFDQMDVTQKQRKDGLEIPEPKKLVTPNGKPILS